MEFLFYQVAVFVFLRKGLFVHHKLTGINILLFTDVIFTILS